MSPTTEIYLCKSGQGFREGRMETSSSIDTKEKARKDAVARCAKDWSLFKVFYYVVNEGENEHRMLFSYNNPQAMDGKGAPKTWQREKRKTKKQSFLKRLTNAIFKD